MLDQAVDRRKLLFAIACGPLLVGASGSAPGVGQPAPPFSFTTLDKRKVKLEDLRGKVVVINLWATWCGPCKAEMPMMHEYFQKERTRGLEMFGVTREGIEVRAWIKKVASLLSYPLANQVLPKYQPIKGSYPSTFIIDRKGILRVAKAGAFSAASFRAAIDPLLNEAP